MKKRAAQKENNSGIIPIFKESFTVLFQCFVTGRKSLSKSSKIKVVVVTNAPSGIPGNVVIESVPVTIELDEIKLSVFRTPCIDSQILETNVDLI